jgi:hypothetical protein
MHATILATALAVLVAGAAPSAAETPAPAPPFTISAEALLWWLKDSPTPVPLVSDGPIGAPGTRVFLGGGTLDANPYPGFRLGAAYAPSEGWGVESSFFHLTSRSTSRSVSSSGLPGSINLRVPFFDPTLPGEAVSSLSSVASAFAGSATERLETSFLGAELNGRMRLATVGAWRVDALAGFRYLRLRETSTLDTSSPFIPPRAADVFVTRDEFDATNSFYGPQVGARARADWGALFVSGLVKVGLGAVVQSVDVAGTLATNDFTDLGPVQTFAGGYFAQPSNIGHHGRTVFGVVPEAQLSAGWRLTPWLALTAGYTFLYVSNVARPGNQVDRAINPTGAPAFTGDPPVPPTGPVAPTFKFHGSDFWAHGLSVGVHVGF